SKWQGFAMEIYADQEDDQGLYQVSEMQEIELETMPEDMPAEIGEQLSLEEEKSREAEEDEDETEEEP
ncbi:MAG: hypothetical protein IJ337_08465, partial [Clostridia bacterium]|nr:hypothetical protein [Clostridia bacterium]